jgi:hypothetical protein
MRLRADDMTDAALLLLLTLAGAVVRATNLGLESLWYDEAATYHLVQGGWQDILARNVTQNSAPPLYPLLLGLLTGPDASEALLRLPALVAGVAAIPLIWLLARQFLPGRWALVAPLLVALSPTQFEYAREVREYSLAFACACLILLANLRYVARPTAGGAVALAAAAILGMLAQYGCVLVAAGAGLAVLVHLLPLASITQPLNRAMPRPGVERRAALIWWLVAQLAIAAAGIALYLTTLRHQLTVSVMSPGGYFYLLDRYWDGTWPDLVTLLTAPEADLVHYAYPGKAFLALAAGGFLVAAWQPARRHAAGFTAAPVVLALAAALAGAYPFGGIRQCLVLTPMLYVCAGIGVWAACRWLATRLSHPAMAPAAVTVLLAPLIAAGVRTLPAQIRFTGSEPLRPAIELLATERRDGEPIYVYAGAVPAFRYYWRGRTTPWQRGAPHVSGLPGERLDRVQAELAALLAQGGRFWVVGSHVGNDDTARLVATLEAGGYVQPRYSRLGSYLLRVTPRRGAP